MNLLSLIWQGQPMSLKQQLQLTVQLSMPAIMAQVSSIIMQYIDASMVGSLGADAATTLAGQSLGAGRKHLTRRFARITVGMGLQGVWQAMCIELCFRGFIFLVRLQRGKWMKTL